MSVNLPYRHRPFVMPVGRSAPHHAHRAVAFPRPRTVRHHLLWMLLPVAGWWLSASSYLPGHPITAWTALIPLLAAIRVMRPARAVAAGALWGFCAAYFSPHAQSVAATLVVMSVAAASFALVGSWVVRWIGFSPYVLATLWLLVEFALAPLGISFELHPHSDDIQWASWVGHVLGTVFIGFIAAWIAAIFVIAGARALAAIRTRRCAVRSHLQSLLSPFEFAGLNPTSWLRAYRPRGPPA